MTGQHCGRRSTSRVAEEKLRLLKIAASRRDVDPMDRVLTVRRSKTEAGERVIPLNADAYNVVLSLYQRAKKLGDVVPDHYVFFACEHGHVDPKAPQKGWRTAWRKSDACRDLSYLWVASASE